MTDKQEHNPIEEPQFDPLMDTQRLLDLGPPAEGTFALEDILAEFGGEAGKTPARQESAQASEEPPPPPEDPESPPPEPQEAAEPEASPEEPLAEPERGEDPEALAEDDAFWEELLPEGSVQEPEEPPQGEEQPPQPEEAPVSGEEAPSMEDIVASTVDAVKVDQEERRERLRQRLEKLRRRERPVKPKGSPLPDIKNEPLPSELAGLHKRRLRQCRKSFRLALPALALLWTPWVLVQCGVQVPFFGESLDNAALCVLLAQTVVSILCWPVYRAALGGLREGAWTIYATALLCTLVTLLDEMTMLLLPERSDAAPLGGVAAAVTVFALWGLKQWHRGMAETFRTAAMGEPNWIADLCGGGVARGAGGREGFCTRTVMEDTSAQWQRLLLPVLAAASLVFAALSSVGQERGQDLFWCWSAILCAASSLVFPMSFCVPYGRLASRLARGGAVLAGQYGAMALSSSRRVVVTDADLFPPGSVSLGGLKLYGEERNRAVSYAATLLVQQGGLLGRLFEDLCQRDRIGYQGLEHFHIHDEGGLSGIIHGETVLVGPPVFLRHKAVHLPGKLSARSVCLAVDGELTAVFSLKYTAADTVDCALRSLRRSGFQLTLAVRDGSVTPKLLRELFGSDFGAAVPELSERLSLSDPEREAEGPNGLLYREGLPPLAALAAGSRRLCQTVRTGNLLAIAGSVSGVLLGFYLTFTGSYDVLTPLLLLTYLLLWAAPALLLVWTADRL